MQELIIQGNLQRGAAFHMPTTEDRRVLDGLQGLDRQVIGAVYDQYFTEVYRYVLYRIGDPQLAEDLASDVFLRLLEAARGKWAPQTNLRGWLLGTTSHVVNDHLRKKYRRREEEISDTLPDRRPDPAFEVDQRDQNRIVNNAYSQLTPEQQHVLALRFGQGYSLEETATFMNKKINAVKALQFRALAALQREVGEVDYE